MLLLLPIRKAPRRLNLPTSPAALHATSTSSAWSTLLPYLDTGGEVAFIHAPLL